MGEENYQALKDNYINRFKQDIPQAQAQLSDQDKQAIEWANKNPNDPRAKQILTLHGM